MLSSEHDSIPVLMNPQQLGLPAQEQPSEHRHRDCGEATDDS